MAFRLSWLREIHPRMIVSKSYDRHSAKIACCSLISFSCVAVALEDGSLEVYNDLSDVPFVIHGSNSSRRPGLLARLLLPEVAVSGDIIVLAGICTSSGRRFVVEVAAERGKVTIWDALSPSSKAAEHWLCAEGRSIKGMRSTCTGIVAARHG